MAARKKQRVKRVEKFLRDSAPVVPLAALKRAFPLTLDGIAERFKTSRVRAAEALSALGNMVIERGGVWNMLREPPKLEHEDKRHLLKSDAHGRYRVGIISDTHYGSAYCREDVCEDLYDWFAAEGVRNVYHAGNWIEGTAPFNKHELSAFGMQAQLDYFIERYPQRQGVRTLYVAGDDHEGWWTQREGIDIGRALEESARAAGRHDLVHLGYKEAFITLEHAKTKKHARMLIDHPGGGSAYADSYAAQKRVESAQSGEKPAVWVFGHWHKLGYFHPRGVHVLLAGCTKDLDTFGRKKGLRYDIGGMIVDMKQDEGGAIVELTPRIRAYFDRGYHKGTAFGLDRKPKRREQVAR
jgi:predicted phosphodiesterase